MIYIFWNFTIFWILAKNKDESEEKETKKDTLRVSRAYGDKQTDKQLEKKTFVVVYEFTSFILSFLFDFKSDIIFTNFHCFDWEGDDFFVIVIFRPEDDEDEDVDESGSEDESDNEEQKDVPLLDIKVSEYNETDPQTVELKSETSQSIVFQLLDFFWW